MNKESGIYIIRNTVNAKSYIGSSMNIKRRWSAHKNSANKGLHHSRYFQKAWDKYGSENFTFTILERAEPIKDDLEYTEQNYIWLFKPEYNSSDKVRFQNISANGRHSLATRMTSLNKSKIGTKQTAEQIKNRSLSRMRLSEKQLYEIVGLYEQGLKYIDIAIKYNVSDQCIYRIVNNKIKAFNNICKKNIKCNLCTELQHYPQA